MRPSKPLKHTGSRNSCLLPDNAAEPACCKTAGWLAIYAASWIQKFTETKKRNAKLPLCLWSAAAPFVITRQQQQWTICLLGSPDCWFFRSELSHIEKLLCESFFAGLGVAGQINVQGEGGGVAMARITRQPLQAWRQFWLHCGSYARVLSELQGHFLFKMTEQKAFFLRSGFGDSRWVTAWHGAVTAPIKWLCCHSEGSWLANLESKGRSIQGPFQMFSLCSSDDYI